MLFGLSVPFVALAGLLAFLLFGRSYAATIFVPEVYSEHVQLGLIDSSDPKTAADNKAFRELLATGVLDFKPSGLDNLGKGGDLISVPALADPPDFERVDHSSDVDLTPSDYTTSTDVAVSQWNKKVYQFRNSDKIRSGKDASIEYSAKIGGKISKRLFEMLMKVCIGALDAVDTPTAGCHVLDLFNGTMGSEAYPTVERVRLARALLGDQQALLNTAVMHSTAFNWLVYDLVTNWKAGSMLGDESARSGLLGTILGIQNWIISDLVPTEAGGANNQAKYPIFLLGPGALWAGYQAEPTVERDTDILKPSTRQLLAVSFAAVAHLRFVKSLSTGNPADTDLLDATKWDEAYDSHKRVLAVKLLCNGVAETA